MIGNKHTQRKKIERNWQFCPHVCQIHSFDFLCGIFFECVCVWHTRFVLVIFLAFAAAAVNDRFLFEHSDHHLLLACFVCRWWFDGIFSSFAYQWSGITFLSLVFVVEKMTIRFPIDFVIIILCWNLRMGILKDKQNKKPK